ncbi:MULTISPECIES: hypothetical protein [unclassified Burkholderia]|uniref:hypothetical protein n=1 Tax=unclassified Burkholderia TaxID=2613784 RepID=UPI001177938A|nr:MULTISPECIES: hypothetical protein [unclassified Burkholderia]MBR8234219.1 hypothetical protein [Burkholderia sp. AU32357]
MNARQRRKAYRAMPHEGERVTWTTQSGRVKAATVEGRKEWFHGQWNEERLNVPCVRRVRVRFDTGGYAHPLVSRLHAA